MIHMRVRVGAPSKKSLKPIPSSQGWACGLSAYSFIFYFCMCQIIKYIFPKLKRQYTIEILLLSQRGCISKVVQT